MESIETFMEIFSNAWQSNNSEAQIRALKDIQAYLNNVPKSDAESALESVLAGRRGLMRYMKEELSKDKISYYFTLKEAFLMLQFCMEYFKQHFTLYIRTLKDMCFLYVTSRHHFFIRKAAAETFRKLIEIFSIDLSNLHTIIEHYNSHYVKKYNKKDGCVLYIIIGGIARHCPTTDKLSTSADYIYSNLLKDLKSQYKPSSQSQPDEIKIYLDCILDMFSNFPLNISPHCSNLYSIIFTLCQPLKAQNTLRMKVLFVFSTLMEPLSDLMYKDCKKWHKLLYDIMSEASNRTIIGTLQKFYKYVAICLIKNYNQETFFYFKDFFYSNIRDANLPSHKLQLILYGLGHISIVFNTFNVTGLDELFQMVELGALPLCSRGNESKESFDLITDYLQTLSKILSSKKIVFSHQVNILTELSLHFVKNFPELKVNSRTHVAISLRTTFINISSLEKTLQYEFFNSFFREGVLWSCSHTLLVDVELQKEMEKSSESSITYKDYLPLWYSLFKLDDHIPNTLLMQIFHEYIQVLIRFIENLNLSLQNDDSDDTISNSFALKAENPADFRFFVNLVDLCVDIFDNIDNVLIEGQVEKLLLLVIRKSYTLPLVSGFYKLIEVLFKKFDSSDSQCTLSASTCELIFQYLLDVLELISRVSGELQLACIHLIFNVPLIHVKKVMDKTVIVFKIAFNTGLTETSIAFTALNTLENWIKDSGTCFSYSSYKIIISCLEPYLSTEVSSNKVFEKELNRRPINLLDSDESLGMLQKKILLFYGSLDTNILIDYVKEKSLKTNATWNKKDLLYCEIPFPDTRLELNFDKSIPRIIELTKSSDRKIKISACESLHTMVIIILGKKLVDQCFSKELCETVVKLSCDLDDVVRNLFHPLMVQLTHYLSSQFMKESRVPQEFVEIFFENLTDEYSQVLRDSCGLYLKEFTLWSLKQSSDTSMTNIRTIIRRINHLAVYPSSKKCIAAAIAFNNLYGIFKDNPNVVNVYWLEFLYAFIKSLEECDDIQILNAIGNVERILKSKSTIFIAKSADRRKPVGLTEATLKGSLIWLFDKCCSISIKGSDKCKQLFENLFPLVSKDPELTNVLLKKVTAIASSNFTGNSVSVTNIKALLSSLHFYNWLIGLKILPFNSNVIHDGSEGANRFSKFFNEIVFLMANEKIRDIAKIYTDTLIDTENLISTMSETLIEILGFVAKMLVKNDGLSGSNFVINRALFLLIARSLLCPYEIGMTGKSFRTIETLYERMNNLLSSMKKYLSGEDLKEFCNIILPETINRFERIQHVDEIMTSQNRDLSELRQFVRGLKCLKNSGIIDCLKEFKLSTKDNIEAIFEALKVETVNNYSCKRIDGHVKEYLEELFGLYLMEFQSDTVRVLSNLASNNSSLVNFDGSKITHGEYFFEVFKSPILRYVLRDPNVTMNVLDEFLDDVPDTIFYLVEKMSIHSDQFKIDESEPLANAVIDRFERYQRLLNDNLSRETKFFNIYKLAVSLKKSPSQAAETNGKLNEWILDQLLSDQDFDKRMTILESFGLCFTNEASRETLHVLFRQFRSTEMMVWRNKLKRDEIDKFQASVCLKVMLRMLAISKSLIVYEEIVKYACGCCDLLIQSKEHLRPYFFGLSDDMAQKSLQTAYELFMNRKTDVERLDVLRYFLLPAMELSSPSAVEKFYEENCQEMVDLATATIDDATINISDRKRKIVSKIGSWNAFEVLFARFEMKFLDVKDPLYPADPKPVNQVLTRAAVNVRTFAARNEEKELARLMHCAALNCCIAMVSLKKEEKFYKFVFLEDRSKNQLIWDRIVDCERVYDLQRSSASIREGRKKLVNIRKLNDDRANCPVASYFHRYDLSCLSLVEDAHAYDLNNVTILSQARQTQDRRLDLSFENDALNDHECMPMLVGVLIHMFNNDIVKLPDDDDSGESNLPDALKLFRNAFLTKEDNVRLYLMRVVSNVKNVVVRYIDQFFFALVDVVRFYLNSHLLNYVVRDVVVLMVESKYVPKNDQERRAAQVLVSKLIDRAPDTQRALYKYNLEMISSLVSLWREQLEYPSGIVHKANSNPDLTVQVVAMFARCKAACFAKFAADSAIKKLAVSLLQHWRDDESLVLLRFQVFGWILSVGEDTEDLARQATRVIEQINKENKNRCASCVCAIYKACRSELKCQQIFKYARVGNVSDDLKPECLELLQHRIPDLDDAQLIFEVDLADVTGLLRNRVIGCEAPAFGIVRRLLPKCSESKILPYLELVAGYCSPGRNSLEHRRLAYSVIVEARRHYSEPGRVNALTTRLLVGGVAEDDEGLLSFWQESNILPRTSRERLLALLELYSPELRDSDFLRFFCTMMLQLADSSNDIGRTMFRPLADCSFKEYGVLVPWRRLNAGSLAPLFAPSLASQLATAALAEFGDSSSPSAAASLRLLATLRSSGFETERASADGEFARPNKIPDPSQNRLSRRMVAEPADQATFFANRNVSRRVELQEKMKREAEARRNSVTIHRRYRHGDFPDVQITYANFVESTRQLAIKDWHFCKDLTVQIFNGLVASTSRGKSDAHHQRFVAQISSAFERIIRAQSGDSCNKFALAIAEVVLQRREIQVDVDAVCRITKGAGQYSLGVLFVEEKLIADEQRAVENEANEPPAKRARSSFDASQDWKELASLYGHLGETDVVKGIHQHPNLYSLDFQEAVSAKADGDYAKARLCFNRAGDRSAGLEREQCLEAQFECLSYLSSWGEIDKKISEIVNRSYDSVWDHPMRKLILPWTLKSQLHMAMASLVVGSNIKDSDFIGNFDKWIKNREVEMKQNFGEEMAVLLLCDHKLPVAQSCVDSSIDRIKRQWVELSPLSVELRRNLLFRLRGTYDICAFIDTLKSKDIESSTKSLIRYWDGHAPRSSDDLLSWSVHVSYRLAFLHVLRLKLSDIVDEDSSLLKELDVGAITQRIKLTELALENKNKHLTKKHAARIERSLDELDDSSLRSEFTMVAAKYKLLSAELEPDPKGKLKNVVAAWKMADTRATDADNNLRISSINCLFDVSASLRKAASENEELASLVASDQFIRENLQDGANIEEALRGYSLRLLKSACRLGDSRQIGQAYTKLSKFCYEILCEQPEADGVAKEFVNSTLSAMEYGSLEAAHYFPCLLKREFYEDDDRMRELFISKSNSIASWLFLSWQTQLLSYLGRKPLSELVVPIVGRLIRDYPQALIYDFRLVCAASPELLANSSEVRSMHERLFADANLDRFFAAFDRVCQPEHYLGHRLLALVDDVGASDLPSAMKQLIDEVYREQSTGALYTHVLAEYRARLQELADGDPESCAQRARRLCSKLYESMRRRLQDARYAASPLKSYSPYLSSFSGRLLEVEVPGQYDGASKPAPRHHVMIFKFGRFVRVTESKCSPIKIDIVGSDAKNYGFLVKFGEDLRQDQRLQQIFRRANETLGSDKSCKQRFLSLGTYQLFPFSDSLGLIQWIDGTRSLKEFVEFSLQDKSLLLDQVSFKYRQWIDRDANNKGYKRSLTEYDSRTVVAKMKELIKLVPWDSFRKTFVMLSTSLDCFLRLRHNFITSYATMCSIHWITGVGDRHPQNTLIQFETGKCYGIDFGLAFGAGLEQSVPELVPFRLTSQILGLLQPFSEQDLFRITMTCVLSALRREKSLVLACLDTFIYEPMEWNKHANKQLQNEVDEKIDTQWIPMEKIVVAKRKLSGINPCAIMLQELSNAHKDNESDPVKYLPIYERILRGLDVDASVLRSNLEGRVLTPQEQVQCLLEAAMDLNLLGRMYVGWSPFV